MRVYLWKQSRLFLPEELANPPQKINVNGKTLDVPENAFTLRYCYMEEGAKVDMITVGDVIVTIAK